MKRFFALGATPRSTLAKGRFGARHHTTTVAPTITLRGGVEIPQASGVEVLGAANTRYCPWSADKGSARRGRTGGWSPLSLTI